MKSQKQKTPIKLQYTKGGRLRRYGVRIVSWDIKPIIEKTSLLSGSPDDTRRPRTCRNFGGTSKTAAIALRKSRRSDGTTRCTTTQTKTSGGKPIANGADSSPMWTNSTHCFSTYRRKKPR